MCTYLFFITVVIHRGSHHSWIIRDWSRGNTGTCGRLILGEVLEALIYQAFQILVFADEVPTRLLIEVDNSKDLTGILCWWLIAREHTCPQ